MPSCMGVQFFMVSHDQTYAHQNDYKGIFAFNLFPIRDVLAILSL